MYTENLQKGEVYTKLPKCITINIVGEGFKLNELLHSEYRVLEKRLYTELSDELEIHFLNLAKAKEKQSAGTEPDEKTQRLVKWLKFIETDDKEVRAMLADNSAVMEQANETVDVMLQDPKERWLYENRMKYEHDKASWEHFGYTQGARQTKLETAVVMKNRGYDADEICSITGITKDVLQTL